MALENIKILYVEDEEIIIEEIIDILEFQIKELIIARNGEEGLNKYNENKPDLIITDINMPIMDGIEMISQIRQIDKDIPIIVVSAHSDAEYFIQTIQQNVNGYIIKPLDLDQFFSTIKECVKKIDLEKENKEYKESLEKLVEKKTTQLKRKNRELEIRYYHDDLTGLQNRYALFNNLKCYENPKLILIDINRFSAINNIYGSYIGDEVLKNVVKKLEPYTMQGCSMYRLSGDEFLLLRHMQNDVACIDMAKSVLGTISDEPIKIDLGDHEIQINVTATIAIVKGIEKESLIEAADMAMKYAKKTHQPIVIYSPELKVKENYQKAIDAITLVKNALQEDNLVPFYQPIYKDDKITYECLVRIISEDKVISPFFFIDEIKHTPYYTELTKTMIKKAFEYFKNKNNSFSINFSFEDITNKELVDYLEKMIDKHQIADKLILEILESESIDNFEIVKRFISKMQSMGVKIAIDDFGSGYSNFVYLLELKPDFIKIDGSLVKNIDKDIKSNMIVKTIIEFAQNLGIKTIAEYVHNKEVFEKIKNLGAYGLQGYYLGEPSKNIKNIQE